LELHTAELKGLPLCVTYVSIAFKDNLRKEYSMTTPTEPQSKVTVRNRQSLISVGLGVVAMFLAVVFKASAIALVLAVLVSGGGIALGWLGFRAAGKLENTKGRNWAVAGMIVGVIALLMSIALLRAAS